MTGFIDKFKMNTMYLMLVNAVIFIVGMIVAIIMYPGYSFFENFISELGIRANTGDSVAAPYPEILNITLYITGFLLVPFFPALILFLKDSLDKSNFFQKIVFTLTALIGISIGPFLIGVGVFDVARDLDLHIFYAVYTMMMIGFTTILWAISVLTLPADSKYKKFRWETDPVFAVIIAFFSFLMTWGVPDVMGLRSLPMAFYQKMVPISFIPYFSIVAWRMIQSEKS